MSRTTQYTCDLCKKRGLSGKQVIPVKGGTSVSKAKIHLCCGCLDAVIERVGDRVLTRREADKLHADMDKMVVRIENAQREAQEQRQLVLEYDSTIQRLKAEQRQTENNYSRWLQDVVMCLNDGKTIGDALRLATRWAEDDQRYDDDSRRQLIEATGMDVKESLKA